MPGQSSSLKGLRGLFGLFFIRLSVSPLEVLNSRQLHQFLDHDIEGGIRLDTILPVAIPGLMGETAWEGLYRGASCPHLAGSRGDYFHHV
jgi:hypothetical protein